jgi:hypothetical protein
MRNRAPIFETSLRQQRGVTEIYFAECLFRDSLLREEALRSSEGTGEFVALGSPVGDGFYSKPARAECYEPFLSTGITDAGIGIMLILTFCSAT